MLTWFQALDPMVFLWLVLTIIFIFAELITIGLFSIWFAAGAVGALLVAIAGGGIGLQIVVFLIISIGLLAATRPWAKRFVNARIQNTNIDALIGEEIRIRERVSNMDQTGVAVVHGKEWTVRSTKDSEIIESGETARIVEIQGVKLIVEKMEAVHDSMQEQKED